MKKTGKIIISAVALVAIAFLTVFLIQVFGVSKVTATKQEKETITLGKEIEKGSGEVCVAENGNRKLFVDPATMNVIVEDVTTGIRYEAVYTNGTEPAEKSLLIVNYVGEDNKFYEWNTFTYCLENESYQLYQIQDGVRIAMNLNEGESARFYEYMPEKMSVEHYDEVFLAGLDRLVESGEMEKSQATKYKSTLSLVYKKSKADNCYNISYVGQPPKSAVKQLIALAKAVGYTTEMLLEDASQFNFTVTFTEPASFDITLDITMKDGELVVNVPSEELASGNDYYTIQNIEVLPNFCLVDSASVTDGYLFVPDGAGALMKMNTYNSKIPDYIRGFYNNDYYTDYYYKPAYGEELMMPIYGMLYLNGTKQPYGFLSIIESGADAAKLEAMLASSEVGVGRQYNKIYCSYDVSQYDWVRVFGEYADNTSEFLVLSPESQTDFTMRYLLYGDDISYFTMAKDYQNYLLSGQEATTYQEDAGLYLEVLGSLSLQERILGIPYNTKHSMTTYSELTDILTDLDGTNLTVSYLGMFDGGMYHKLMNEGNLVSKNGSKNELQTLLSTATNQNTKLFFETDFLKIYESGNGFMKRIHGLQDFSKAPVEMYGYGIEHGTFKQYSNHYYLLHPNYLVDTVKDFVDSVNGDYNYYLHGLTSDYYANYGKDYVSPSDAQRLVEEAIESFPDTASLALDNPRADRLIYGEIAVDVSRESSDYNSFYCTIPFRQLVMNGMIPFTTKTANNNSDTMKYILLQAVELGAIPKFTISSKSVDVLKDSKYSYYYSIQYSLLQDDIKEVYAEYEKAMEVIGVAHIVNHEMLQPNVYRTEYENGTVVIANYTGKTYSYENQEVESQGFLLLEGR